MRTDSLQHQRLIDHAKILAVSLNVLCGRRLALPSSLEPTCFDHLREIVSNADRFLNDALLGVVLFGSQARGEAMIDSDWDVLLVIKDEIPVSRDLYRRFDETSPADIRKVEAHFAHLPGNTAEATGFWSEIALDGIVLYEHEFAVSRFLSRVRHDIANGVIVRRSAQGHGYWVHREASQV